MIDGRAPEPINHNYVFEAALYRQGIWNYIGRAQYHTGRLEKARQFLERALFIGKEDHLARIYLSLVRARVGDTANGAKYIEGGMKGLYDGWSTTNRAGRLKRSRIHDAK